MVFFSAADPPSRDLECPRAPLAPLCAPQPHIVRTHTDDAQLVLERVANGSPRRGDLPTGEAVRSAHAAGRSGRAARDQWLETSNK